MSCTTIDHQRNADVGRFNAACMFEGIQEYQQTGENLWKEWCCTTFQNWHSATAQGDDKTRSDQTANGQRKNILRFISSGLMTKAYKTLGDDET
jgi:hypothetical protein